MIPAEAYNGDEPFIFISYAHKDSELVFPIIERMSQDGYRVWYDGGIEPGKEWDDFIASKISSSGYFIAFISENYIESDNCKDELAFAREFVKNRVLVYLEDVSLPNGLAMRLGRIQAILKFKYDDNSFYKKLYSSSKLNTFRTAPKVTQIPETTDSSSQSNTDSTSQSTNKLSKKSKIFITLGVVLFVLLLTCLVGLYFYDLSPKTVPWLCSHNDIQKATCTTPAICLRCGEKLDKATGHSYLDATCTEPKTCSECGATSGRALDHNFSIAATCTEPERCTRCDEVNGEPLGHEFSFIDCETGSQCPRCREIIPAGHEMVDLICINCGYSEEITDMQELNHILGFQYDNNENYHYELDEEGHVTFITGFTNLSDSRTISEILVYCIFVNEQGQVVPLTDGASSFRIPCRHEINPNSYYQFNGSSEFSGQPQYISGLVMYHIVITYTDGTSITYTNPDYLRFVPSGD